jgi:hypothetical protein
MSSPEAEEGRDLSLAVRLDEVCNRFESAWRAGVQCLEDFVDGWHGDERLALLRELILLDMDYRRCAGRGGHPTAGNLGPEPPAVRGAGRTRAGG